MKYFAINLFKPKEYETTYFIGGLESCSCGGNFIIKKVWVMENNEEGYYSERKYCRRCGCLYNEEHKQ